MNDVILSSNKLSKSYNDGASKITVLNGIDISIAKGERLAIIGPQVLVKVLFCICLGA